MCQDSWHASMQLLRSSRRLACLSVTVQGGVGAVLPAPHPRSRQCLHTGFSSATPASAQKAWAHSKCIRPTPATGNWGVPGGMAAPHRRHVLRASGPARPPGHSRPGPGSGPSAMAPPRASGGWWSGPTAIAGDAGAMDGSIDLMLLSSRHLMFSMQVYLVVSSPQGAADGP